MNAQEARKLATAAIEKKLRRDISKLMPIAYGNIQRAAEEGLTQVNNPHSGTRTFFEEGDVEAMYQQLIHEGYCVEDLGQRGVRVSW